MTINIGFWFGFCFWVFFLLSYSLAPHTRAEQGAPLPEPFCGCCRPGHRGDPGTRDRGTGGTGAPRDPPPGPAGPRPPPARPRRAWSPSRWRPLAAAGAGTGLPSSHPAPDLRGGHRGRRDSLQGAGPARWGVPSGPGPAAVSAGRAPPSLFPTQHLFCRSLQNPQAYGAQG